jgi:hypothetical protein
MVGPWGFEPQTSTVSKRRDYVRGQKLEGHWDNFRIARKNVAARRRTLRVR